jgi:hypothetical protein
MYAFVCVWMRLRPRLVTGPTQFLPHCVHHGRGWKMRWLDVWMSAVATRRGKVVGTSVRLPPAVVLPEQGPTGTTVSRD